MVEPQFKKGFIPLSDSIRRAVDAAYAKIGLEGSKPPEGMDFPTGAALALSLGYPCEEIQKLPPGPLESFVGAAPLVAEILATGPSGLVADCGCGSGVDSLILALSGHSTISMDAQPEMLARLARSLEVLGLTHMVHPLLARLPHLPLSDGSAGWLLLNGVANLIPERRVLMDEAARVLAPGGKLRIADVIALEPLPEEIRRDAHSWAWCVGGAATSEEWLAHLADAGFTDLALDIAETFPPLARGVIRATRKHPPTTG